MTGVLVLLTATLLAFGCAGNGKDASNSASKNAGRIRGSVRLNGTLPPPSFESPKEHGDSCGHQVPLQRIVLVKGNGVQDSFVYLDGIDGIKDARSGRSPYLWTVLSRRSERGGRLREALFSTARIILLGLGMDVIYQYRVLKTFYPDEALLIALMLAVVPYFLVRGPVTRIAYKWIERSHRKATAQSRE